MRYPIKLVMPAFLAASLLAFSAPLFAETVEYTVDPDHTQVRFSWDHLGFSRPSAQFDEVSGSLRWDADQPTASSVEMTMPVASINSHVPLLDDKFVSEEFFDAEQFPIITFKSTRIERADATDHFKVHGKLTAHGVTRPVVLDAELRKAAPHPMMKAPALGFSAVTSFDRSEFGVDKFVPMVSDRVRIDITVEAIEAKGYAKAIESRAESSE